MILTYEAERAMKVTVGRVLCAEAPHTHEGGGGRHGHQGRAERSAFLDGLMQGWEGAVQAHSTAKTGLGTGLGFLLPGTAVGRGCSRFHLHRIPWGSSHGQSMEGEGENQ